MSEALDALIEARERFPFGELDGEQAIAAFEDLVGPYASEDFVCVMSRRRHARRVPRDRGPEAGLADFFAGFETIRFTPDGLVRGYDGETLVELVHLSGKPKGAPIARRAGRRRGLPAAGEGDPQIEYYLDRDAALRGDAWPEPMAA